MRGYLVDEGKMPLDSCLILFPLQPELVAELLLGLFDVPDSQFPLLSLLGVGKKQPQDIRGRSYTSPSMCTGDNYRTWKALSGQNKEEQS